MRRAPPGDARPAPRGGPPPACAAPGSSVSWWPGCRLSRAPCSGTWSGSPRPSWRSPRRPPSNRPNRRAPWPCRPGPRCRRRSRTRSRRSWRTCCTVPRGPRARRQSLTPGPQRSRPSKWPWTSQTWKTPRPPRLSGNAGAPPWMPREASSHSERARVQARVRPPWAAVRAPACWPRSRARQNRSQTQSAWPSAWTQQQNLSSPARGPGRTARTARPPAPAGRPGARPRLPAPQPWALAAPRAPREHSAPRPGRT
mmetsp:Transcript_32251/g.100154  ORF Transcript_32251/g.100154 Transcript_32251/m.100154 type:complete len:255 (-) Transcript_32251:639-1403(-)